jgi:hypothetical protein
VKAYYDALAHHEFNVAATYAAPAVRQAITSENSNLLTLSRLKINATETMGTSQPGLPGNVPTSGYSAFAQVTVSYNATFRRIIDARSGPQIQFLYLGQAARNIGWQIVSIGSGP